MDLEDRFWAKVEEAPGGGCWIWTGAREGSGYGQVSVNGRDRLAHRIAYELVVGVIPADRELDHLCRNHACVNPAHLEPVTHRENVLRGAGVAAQAAARIFCPQGHVLDGYGRNGRGRSCRYCRTCKRIRNREYARRRGGVRSVR